MDKEFSFQDKIDFSIVFLIVFKNYSETIFYNKYFFIVF